MESQISKVYAPSNATGRQLTITKIAHKATVVRDLGVRALLAARDMPAECCRAAALDRRHHLQLAKAHMEALSLNPDQVTHIQRLTVRTLQHRCVRCETRGQCALDLADEFADPGWQYWWDYCPNAATLMTLSTLRGIA
jgi:hypothetical protein